MEYVITCENPRCGKSSPATPQQREFLDRCRGKDMAVAMIQCPVCGWSQSFRFAGVATQPASSPVTSTADASAHALPPAYVDWLNKRTNSELELGERKWQLRTLRELKETMSVDGGQTTYLHQAKRYAQLLAQYVPHLSDAAGREIPLARLNHFLTIGHDNVELLCLDSADNFSVWAFAPDDGGLLEQLTASLPEFLDRTIVEDV